MAEAPTITSELQQPLWGVLTFDQVLGNELTYADAVEVMGAAVVVKHSGVVIVTAAAADQVEKNRSKQEQPAQC